MISGIFQQLDPFHLASYLRCYTSLIMAEGRSRIWVWVLVGGGVFALFVVAVFTLVYMTFGGQDEEKRFLVSGQKLQWLNSTA